MAQLLEFTMRHGWIVQIKMSPETAWTETMIDKSAFRKSDGNCSKLLWKQLHVLSPKQLDVLQTVSVLVSAERCCLAQASVTSWQSSARYPASTHQVQWTCLQLLRPGCMELTACRHPVHDEQTNFQNITEISFIPSSFWYFIVTANCLLLDAHVLIVTGALKIYIDDDDDDDRTRTDRRASQPWTQRAAEAGEAWVRYGRIY